MTRVVLGLGVLLFACAEGGGPSLVPPYEGPLVTGQQNPTGYQPGSIDIFDVVGGVVVGVGEETVVVDMTTPGYYNSAIGTTLDGTDPFFVVANGTTGKLLLTSEPSLAAASSILGPWLTAQVMPPSASWNGPMTIPAQWPVFHETAIIYSIVNPGPQSWKLTGSFGVDNGILVWMDGAFKFGVVEEGSWAVDEYPDIDLGVIGPGQHFLQVLREDHSGAQGYWIEVKAQPVFGASSN
jgi:hypothetical protein